MSNQKSKGKKLSTALGFILIMVIAFFVGIGMGVIGSIFPSPPIAEDVFADMLLSLLVFLAAMIVETIIHEAGHLVFGLASGYRFSSFRILSLMILKTDDGIKLKRHSVPGTLGQCLMTPPPMKDGRIPVALYNLGGSILNFITAAIAFVLFIFLHEVYLLSTILSMLALTGLLSGLANAIPMSAGPVDNDGKNLLSLLRDPVAMRSFWVQLSVTEQLSRGVRLSEMPEEWFDAPPHEEMLTPMSAALGAFRMNRLIDEGKYDCAIAQMDSMLGSDVPMAGIHRQMMTCDKISLELIKNPTYPYQPLLTKELLDIMKAMKTHPSVLRTQYIIKLLGEWDPVGAAEVKTQFESSAKSYPYPQEMVAERELMDLAFATHAKTFL